MPAHIDEPAPGMPVDPGRFRVRGWVWLEAAAQGELEAVEIWSGGAQLGATRAFQPRPDVNAAFVLPPSLQTGFELFVQHSAASTSAPFDIEVRARLRDGRATETLCSSRIAPLPLEHHPLGMLRTQIPTNALGLEIGAHALPVPGLSPFYTDAVAEFAGSAGRVDFLADALALPVPDDCLDYLCSSHVLEHLPNPLAALHEWHRVLRPGGWLYLVVPDKRFTFDAPRAVTSCEHLLGDFLAAQTAAGSAEHVDEFIYQTHWEQLRPGTPAAEKPIQQAAARQEYLDALAAGRPIDIHFHTFTPDSLERVLRASGLAGEDGARFRILAQAERYPPERGDGIAFLLQKTGPVQPSTARETFTLRASENGDRALPLVCPLTLQPLRCETASEGARVLVAGSGARYAFVHERPVLLPPVGAQAVRPWGRKSWRATRHVAAKLRLAMAKS